MVDDNWLILYIEIYEIDNLESEVRTPKKFRKILDFRMNLETNRKRWYCKFIDWLKIGIVIQIEELGKTNFDKWKYRHSR